MTQSASAATTATATGPTLQASVALEELYRREDYYGLLNVAVSRLAEDPGDTAVGLLACRAYVTLGLIGPARELLAGPLASLPEVESLMQQVGHAPSGRASWRAMQERFEVNSARVYARYPELRRLDRVFRDTPRALELFCTVDGNLHLSAKTVDGLRRWLPDLQPIRQIASKASLPHDPKASICAPYVIICDRFNVFLDWVFEATREMFLTFSPRIYVLQPDLQQFAASLYAADSVENLCHDRISLFVGPKCVEEFEQHLAAHPVSALPVHVVQGPGQALPESTTLVDALRRLSSRQERHVQSVVDRVKCHHESLAADYWTKRFSPGTRLRVLGITSRFTTFLKYSMRDWQAAFERLGHEFRLLIEPNDHDLNTSAEKAMIIDEWKPDLVVVIDHLRHEYGVTIPPNLPYVCWIQDELNNLTSSKAGRSVGPMDFVCGFSKGAFVRDFSYPPQRFLPCVIPTDCGLYDATPVPTPDRERYACDVSATTHASKTPDQMRDEYAARLNEPAACGLLNSIHEELMRRVGRGEFLTSAQIHQLICQCEQLSGVHINSEQIRRGVFADFAARIHDRSIRHKTLEWVGRWAKRTGRTFALYGNGWDQHPMLGEFARGPIANGYDLRCVYQASTISLHISGFGSVHQRVLDGLSSGGFFLVRHNPCDFIGEAAECLTKAIREGGVQTMEELRTLDMPDVQRCLGYFGAAELLLPSDPEPPIPLVVEYLAAKTDNPVNASQRLPRFAEITFDTEGAFAERVEFFLAHPDQRAKIASKMRQAVHRQYTYDGLTESLLAFIRERLPGPQAFLPTRRDQAADVGAGFGPAAQV